MILKNPKYKDNLVSEFEPSENLRPAVDKCCTVLSSTFDSFTTKEVLADVKRFAENCRNVLAHSNESRTIVPETFIASMFSGLKMLDRLNAFKLQRAGEYRKPAP